MHVDYHLQLLASIVKSHHAPHYSIIITLNSAGYFYTLLIAALLRHWYHLILICIIWYWWMLYATDLYFIILFCIIWYWLMLYATDLIIWYWSVLYDTGLFYMILTIIIRYCLVLYDTYLQVLACILWYWPESGPSYWIEPVHGWRLLDFIRDHQVNVPPHSEACLSFQVTGRCACGIPPWLGLEPGSHCCQTIVLPLIPLS